MVYNKIAATSPQPNYLYSIIAFYFQSVKLFIGQASINSSKHWYQLMWSPAYLQEEDQWQATHKKLELVAFWPKSRANVPNNMRCKTDEMVAWMKRMSEVAHSAVQGPMAVVMCWCASAAGCARRPGYGEGRWSGREESNPHNFSFPRLRLKYVQHDS